MEFVYLAGLPRSGSTLLCNILSMYPGVEATPSSPLCNMLSAMRRTWSDDPFLLGQLDHNLDEMHQRLVAATRGFMLGFHSNTQADILVDKNRGWLGCVETLRVLQPNFKMILTIRDLRDIYASVERRHRNTLMLEFPDHMEQNLVDVRASQLMADNGVIGGVWRSMYNLGDVLDIMGHIYVWRYEDFLLDPYASMESLSSWLGVGATISLENIPQSTYESDSHYRQKYSHRVNSSITPPSYSSNPDVKAKFGIPDTSDYFSPRILNMVMERFADYYRTYYPEVIGETMVNSENFDAAANGGIVNDVPQSHVNLADSIAESVRQETANDTSPESEL